MATHWKLSRKRFELKIVFLVKRFYTNKDLITAIERLRAQGRDIKLPMAGRDYGDDNLGHSRIDYRGMVTQE